jgi:hypothetical protein
MTSATTTVAATSAAVSAATTAATATTLAARLGFVHPQRATVKICAVHSFDSGFRRFIVFHFDKTEATTATGVPIHYDPRIGDVTEFGKCRSKSFFFRTKVEIAHIERFSH